MKKLLFLVSILLTLSLGSGAWASLYSGAISNRTDGSGTGALLDPEGGLGATGNSWAGTGNNKSNRGVRLEWNIDYNAASKLWTYTYNVQLGAGVKQIALYMALETASNFTASDLIGWKASDYAGNNVTEITGPGDFAGTEKPATQDSNFGLSLLGYRWDCATGFASADTSSVNYAHIFTLQTTRAPMWGDWFMGGGLTNDGYTGAWNSQFSNLAHRPSGYGDGNNGGWVLVPGAVAAAPVPIPAPLFLFGSGLSGLCMFKRRRTKLNTLDLLCNQTIHRGML